MAKQQKRLAYTVVVREYAPADPNPNMSPTIKRTETFLAGVTLPDWAAQLVGDHVYEQEPPSPPLNREPVGFTLDRP